MSHHIIDFHSHILPGIDDGSKDISMTHQMLRASAEQGTDIMVATPHFYPTNTTPDKFLQQRAAAAEQLRALEDEGLPRVYLGAEVAFFNGISRMEQLEELCIEGTELLLLEMPFGTWSQETLREVERIGTRGVTPIIAHLDRYLSFHKHHKAVLEELTDLPLYVQINVESLEMWRMRGSICKLFQANRAHLLGSDCHNTTSRPAGLAQGRERLRRKLGEEILDEMDACGAYLLGIQ